MKTLNYSRIPRKTAATAGVLYLLTFVSVPTISLYKALHQPDYGLNSSSDTPAIIGGLLEIIVALGCIGSAITLYPLLKKQNESLALALVASRVLEAGTIFIGVAFILAAVGLHQQGAEPAAQVIIRMLVTLYDRVFLLGQSFMPAVNDALLGYLLYQSRLVPRAIPVIGIMGVLPLLAGYLAIMFGHISRDSAWAGLSAVLVALFELTLGIYLTVKGFSNRSEEVYS
ncbi:DUF4386 domain-containing protein [Mucilaginibacter terrigena]|nr:DUF4386 domain-containing protein [Mucilaginibacter terrigena]